MDQAPLTQGMDAETAKLYKTWLITQLQEVNSRREQAKAAEEAAKEAKLQEEFKQKQIREDNERAIAKREAEIALCSHKRPPTSDGANPSKIGGWTTNPYTQEMILACNCGKTWVGKRADLKRELEPLQLWPNENELGGVLPSREF